MANTDARTQAPKAPPYRGRPDGTPAPLARTDSGFTLIELMVVLLISAILLGVGVPTFVAARNQAANATVESHLVSAADGARDVVPSRAAFVRPSADATYAEAIAVQVAGGPANLTFVRARAGQASTGPSVISEWRGPTRISGAIPGYPGPYGLELSALSPVTGRCLHLVIDMHVGGWTASTLGLPGPGSWWTATTGATCTALTAPPSGGRSWHHHAANAAEIRSAS